MSTQSETRQTPLPDLLDSVPEDIVLGIPGDEPVFQSYTNIPIGKLANQAAAELRRLHEVNQELLEALKRIDQALQIPAAEYVPAISDVFKMIDSAIAKAEGTA